MVPRSICLAPSYRRVTGAGFKSLFQNAIDLLHRKDRVDDAMHATRAAVEEGIIPGGGAALIYAGQGLTKLQAANDDCLLYTSPSPRD